MVFSSLVFLFLFLAIHLFVYHMVDERYHNVVLLVSSLIFYSWGGPRYLVLLMGNTLASWGFALLIERSDSPGKRKLWLVAECVVLLGVLGIFKYLGFFCANFQAIFGVPELIPEIVLPIGISFYTFQLISYVVDVYRGEIDAQPSYWKLLLYSSLFHQCIAGPIVQYGDVPLRGRGGRDVEGGVGAAVQLPGDAFRPAFPESVVVEGLSLDADALAVQAPKSHDAVFGILGGGLSGLHVDEAARGVAGEVEVGGVQSAQGGRIAHGNLDGIHFETDISDVGEDVGAFHDGLRPAAGEGRQGDGRQQDNLFHACKDDSI